MGFILSAILLLLHYPQVQSQAFTEIQSAIGSDRLPNLSDKGDLPYIDAIIQEIHRFNPAIPLATHSNIEEDYYMGYRIPKKTWVMVNIWWVVYDTPASQIKCVLGPCCTMNRNTQGLMSFSRIDFYPARRATSHETLGPQCLVLGAGNSIPASLRYARDLMLP